MLLVGVSGWWWWWWCWWFGAQDVAMRHDEASTEIEWHFARFLLDDVLYTLGLLFESQRVGQ